MVFWQTRRLGWISCYFEGCAHCTAMVKVFWLSQVLPTRAMCSCRDTWVMLFMTARAPKAKLLLLNLCHGAIRGNDKKNFSLTDILPPSWDISDQGWYVGGRRGESSGNLFVPSTTRKTLAKDNFFQQKTHNLEIMICSADCAHNYAERKKILQMKEWNSTPVGLMENSKETLTLPARGGRQLACWKEFLYYSKGAAKILKK